MDVALIDAGTGLAVVPPVLAAVHFRAGGRVETVGVARAQFPAMDRGMMEKFVVTARCIGRAFQADDAADLVLIFRRHLQHDRSAHRASKHHRPIEPERKPHGSDDAEIGFGRETKFLQPPAVGRRRTSVIRHVERHDPKTVGDRLVVHHVAELPAVIARGVQTEQRDSGAGFLDKNPVTFSGDIDGRVAAGDRFEFRHGALPSRA